MTQSRFFRILVAASPLWVAMLLYGYTLRLTLFLDDAPQFFILSQLGDFEYWGGSLAYHYYRPMLFAFWKIAEWLSGGYDPVLLHWVNVVTFGVTGVLVGQLARKLGNSPWVGALAGMAFVSFPFAYQAVILVGAQYHLFLTLCTVAVLYLAVLWMEGRIGFGGWILACAVTFIGAFSHENSPAMLPLVALLIGIRFGWRSLFQRRALMLLIPITTIIFIYMLLWLTVPRDQEYGALQNAESIIWSLAMLLQGLVYPLDALVALAIPQGSTVLILALVALTVGAAFFVVRQQDRAWLGFGILWVLLGALPASLLLDTAYVDGSSRLMLFGSPGSSLFWALMLGALASHRLGRVVALGIGITALVVSGVFLNRVEDYATMQNRYMFRLTDLINHQPASGAEGGVLLVNAVDFLTPEAREDYIFLRGSEGVAFMFHTNDYALQIRITGGYQPPNLLTASVGELLRNAGYAFTPHQPEVSLAALPTFVRERDIIYVTQFDDDGFLPVYVGGRNLAGNDDPLTAFGGAIHLLEADVMHLPTLQRVAVRLRWQVMEPQAIKPFVHVICDGALIANSDADPWGNTYPFAAWTSGEIQTEFREIPLPQDYDPAACQTLVGVYDPATGTRLPTPNGDTYPLTYLGESRAAFPFTCLNPPPQFPLLCEDV